MPPLLDLPPSSCHSILSTSPLLLCSTIFSPRTNNAAVLYRHRNGHNTRSRRRRQKVSFPCSADPHRRHNINNLARPVSRMLQSSAPKGSRTTRNNHNTSALPRQIPFPYSGALCRRHNTKGLARPVSRMLRRAGPAPKNSRITNLRQITISHPYQRRAASRCRRRSSSRTP